MGNTYSFINASTTDKSSEVISAEGILELKANIDKDIRGQSPALTTISKWLSAIGTKTNRCVCLAGPLGMGQSRFIKLVAKAFYGPHPIVSTINLGDIAEIGSDEDVETKIYESKGSNVIVIANVTQHHTLLLKTLSQVIATKMLNRNNDSADYSKTLFVISFHIRRDTTNADRIIEHTKREFSKINSSLLGQMDEIIPFMALPLPTVKAIITNELANMGRLDLLPKVNDVCSSVFNSVRGFHKSVHKYVQELDGGIDNEGEKQEGLLNKKRSHDNTEESEAKRNKVSPSTAASTLSNSGDKNINNSHASGNTSGNTNNINNNGKGQQTSDLSTSTNIPQPQVYPQQEEIRRLKEALEKKEKDIKEAKKAELFRKLLQDLKHMLQQQNQLKPMKIFFSYAWETNLEENRKMQAMLTKIGGCLRSVGIEYCLDVSHMQGNVVNYMKENLDQCDRCLLICTPRSKERIYGTTETMNNMQREVFRGIGLMLTKKNFVIPLVLAGDRKSSVSPLMDDLLSLDFTDPSTFEEVIASPSPMGVIPMIINLPDQQPHIRDMYASFWECYKDRVKLLDLSQ